MRFILGVILAAAALFMWGYVYWGLSPFPDSIIQSVDDHEAVAASLQMHFNESGTYLMPQQPKNTKDVATMDAYTRRHEEGPVVMMFYNHAGAAPMDSTRMAIGFGHSVLVAFLGGIICLAAAPRTYVTRVMLIFWTTMFAAVWTQVGNVIWWYYPMDYCLLQLGYMIIGGMLMALILAAFIRPDPEMA